LSCCVINFTLFIDNNIIYDSKSLIYNANFMIVELFIHLFLKFNFSANIGFSTESSNNQKKYRLIPWNFVNLGHCKKFHTKNNKI